MCLSIMQVLSGDHEDDPEVIASFKEGEMFGEVSKNN